MTFSWSPMLLEIFLLSVLSAVAVSSESLGTFCPGRCLEGYKKAFVVLWLQD